MAASAAVSAVLCSAVVDSILKPAAQGLPYLEQAECDATLAAVVASLPIALALLEQWLSLAPEVHFLPHPVTIISLADIPEDKGYIAPQVYFGFLLCLDYSVRAVI